MIYDHGHGLTVEVADLNHEVVSSQVVNANPSDSHV